MDLEFEWDDKKESINIKKHKISFETAKLVFNDPMRLERVQYINGEERYETIGRVGNVIVVVYTLRGEVHRLITARTAEKNEEKVYYGYY